MGFLEKNGKIATNQQMHLMRKRSGDLVRLIDQSYR
jgi:hypothetical protein